MRLVLGFFNPSLMNINAYGVSVAPLLVHGCCSAHTGNSAFSDPFLSLVLLASR